MDTLGIFTVRGRVVDPYRGDVGAPDAAAFERRDCDRQPIADVAAAFARVPEARLTRAGRRFILARGADRLFVAFASAAPAVAIDDAMFEGDPLLAIELLHALFPLFGPVEIRSGRFVDLLDGHEPLERVTGRYRTYWIDLALLRAKTLGGAEKVSVPPEEAPVSRRKAIVAGLFFGALVIAIIVLWSRDGWSKAAIGESCQRGDDCRSGECQPFDRARPDSPGVCTEACVDDGDCPRDMVCGAQRCVDRAWR